MGLRGGRGRRRLYKSSGNFWDCIQTYCSKFGVGVVGYTLAFGRVVLLALKGTLVEISGSCIIIVYISI